MVALTCRDSSNSFQINLPFHHGDPDVHPLYLLPISIHQSFHLHSLLSSFLAELPQSDFLDRKKKVCLCALCFREERDSQEWIGLSKRSLPWNLSVPLMQYSYPPWTLAGFALLFYQLIRDRVNDLEALAKQCDSHLPSVCVCVCVCVGRGNRKVTFPFCSYFAMITKH